jgi:cytochrome c oxidase subunit 4
MSASTEHAAAHAPAHEEQHHVVPLWIYFLVFGALMLLTWVTVAVSHVDLGSPQILGDVRIHLNVVVALLIAITKATLVVLFFMHVWYSPRLVQIIVGSSVIWLIILIGITVSDYLSRGWLGNPGT